MHDSYAAVQAYLSRRGELEAAPDPSFVAGLRKLLKLRTSEVRMILSLRSGLGASSETLASIGMTLGITRERVRQIEDRELRRLKRDRLWLDAVGARARSATEKGAVALDDLEQDPWWRDVARQPTTLNYFCDKLLSGTVRVVSLAGRDYLSASTRDQIVAAQSAAKQAVKSMTLPARYETLRAAFHGIVEPLGSTLAEVIENELRGEMSFGSPQDGVDRVVAVGTSYASRVLTLLHAQSERIHVEVVYARVGRGAFPEEVIYFGAGHVGLQNHFPEFSKWVERVVPAALDVMRSEAPERQWHCLELHDEIADKLALPKWLDEWHVAALLRRSPEVRYLGRLRASLAEAAPDERIGYRDAAHKVLEKAKAPMQRAEVLATLMRTVGVREATLSMVFAKPPFLLMGADRVGLIARDVPGGVGGIPLAAERVAEELEDLKRGLGGAELAKIVHPLSAAHQQWTPEMCLSVLRGDSRFRLSLSGGVGLADWDTARVPSRKDLLT